MLHGMGREFGATTGRARRCGWFDAVATRYAGMINGIDDIAVTNLDGLDTLAIDQDLHALQARPQDARSAAERLRASCTIASRFTRRCPAGRRRRDEAPHLAASCRRTRAAYLKRLAELTGAQTDHRQRRPEPRPDHRPLAERRPLTATPVPPRTSPSSWMATGAGRKERGLPRIKGHEQGARIRARGHGRVRRAGRGVSHRLCLLHGKLAAPAGGSDRALGAARAFHRAGNADADEE